MPDSQPTVAAASLADLITGQYEPEPSHPENPVFTRLDAPPGYQGTYPPTLFECRVFEHLLSNAELLGLNAVWRCKNARIDGLVELVDGRRLALEIKLQMGWAKACQAGHQIAWFHARSTQYEMPIHGALILFEGFSGDWAKRRQAARAETGWSNFYSGHHIVDGLRVDLFRLRDGRLTTMLDEIHPVG